MKYLAGLLLFFLGVQVGFGQTLTVVDAETKEPLVQVTLMSPKPRKFAATDAEGKVDLAPFKGVKQIEFRMLGYQTVTKSYKALKTNDFKLALPHATINIDEIVVSATRWQQKSNNIPVKITTVSPRELELANPQTAADLLNVSGEVFIQKSQQGGGSPMIRGFATNRLLYTVDGVRMNTAIFRSGNIQNVISLDPFATESTEIFFGPGSVIYGSDAIGGVMSFQTLTPQLADTAMLIHGAAETRYSSANNERTGHFHVNLGWEKWALVSSISANNYGDLRMGSNGPDDYLKHYYVQRIDSADVVLENENPEKQIPSAYRQMNLMQKVRFKPNTDWDLQYGFHYSETSDYGRFDRHLRTRDGQPRYAQWDYGPQIWMMNNLSAAHQGANPVYDKATLRLAHQFFEESRIDRDLNELWQRNRIEQVDAYSVNLDFVKDFGHKNELFYGIEYVQNDVHSEAFNRHIETDEHQPVGTRYPEAVWASYAAYASAQIQLADKLTLHSGVRYNHFSISSDFDTAFYNFNFTHHELNNGALTGNLGLTFRPDQTWVIKGNLSTGFRAPNVDDIGKVFDSEPGSVVVPNPNLEAEYAYNGDISVAKTFGDWLKVDVTVFYTHLRNALVRRDYTLNGQDSIMYDGTMSRVQAIQNVAEANVYGVQAGAEINLPGGLGITSDFNYQQGEEENDDGSVSPSRHASPWFGVTRIEYKNEKLNLQLYSQYSGKVNYEDLAPGEQNKPELYAADGSGNHYSPAWYTINFKAMYQINKNLSLSAGLENITDQRYRPYSSGLTAPGRNFVMSLKVMF